VTALDPGRQERFHGYPQFLPDGRHFLYFAKSNLPGQSATFVGALDGAAATKVLENESRALFAAPGHLLYVRNGQLMAHRFDPDRRRVSGDPTPVADRLWGTDDFGAVTVSESSIAYAAARPLTTQLSVVDRNGKPVASIGEPGEWVDVDVAPDERRLAAERLGGPSRNGSIFVADIGRGTVSRLTTDPSWNLRPVWSPDGARIVFASGRSGAASLYVRNADGSGADEPLVRSPSLKYPNAWIADGRVIYTDLTTPGAGDVLAVPADPKGSQPSLVAGGPFHQTAGRVSSDGKWLAFQSDDSGRPEVYVKPLNGSGRTQVSLSGGILPLWRRDSAELYFLSPDKKVMATPVVTNPTFSAGRPAPLFDLTVTPDPWRVPYGVLDSGSKFVVIRFVSRDTAPQVEVLVNWTELVAKPQAAK
jgi:Tol biopolymer transport system component